MRQCRVVLRDPQNFSQDDVSKFVASLALSVHVEAALHSVSQLDRIAVQVCECVELLPVCSSCITVQPLLKGTPVLRTLRCVPNVNLPLK